MSNVILKKFKFIRSAIFILLAFFFNGAHALGTYPATCVSDKGYVVADEWQLWYVSLINPNLVGSGNDCVINSKGVTGMQYTIDVTLGDNISFANFIILADFGLNYVGDGKNDVAYSGLASFEVLDSSGSVVATTANVASFGIGLKYVPINQYGAPRNDMAQISQNANPQAFEFSIRDVINSQNQYFANQFAECKATDLLGRAQGSTLKISRPSGITGVFRARVKVELEIKNPVSLTNYPDAEFFDAYKVPFQSALNVLNEQIDNDSAFIANIGGSSTVLSQIKAEAAALKSDAAVIVNAYSIRKPYADPKYTVLVKLPNPEEYKKLILIGYKLAVLKNNSENIVASASNSLVHYLWDSTSKWQYDENVFAVNNNLSGDVVATVSQNEFEPISIVLQNLTESNVSNVQITDISLQDPSNGNVFPSTKIDLRMVKSWWMPSATTIDFGTKCSDAQCLKNLAVLAPELLLKDDNLVLVGDSSSKSNALKTSLGGASPNYTDVSTSNTLMPINATTSDALSLQPFIISSYKSRQIWLTIDGNGVVPGNYVGNLTVSFVESGLTKIHAIPFTVSVKPFYLQDSSLEYGVYYHGNLNVSSATGFIRARDKNTTQFTAEMQNIKKHGIKYPLQILDNGGTHLEEYLAIRMQEGLSCDKLFFWNGIAEADYKGGDINTVLSNGLSLKTRSLNVVSTQCPGAEIYMYGLDEATEQVVINGEAPYWDILRSNGLKIYNTIYSGIYDKVVAARNQGGNSYPNADLDIVNFAHEPDSLEIQKWRNAGKGVYSYGNPQSGIPDPYIYRRNYGLFLWQNNYTGAMDFAYQEGGHSSSTSLNGGCFYNTPTSSAYCSPWNDFDDRRWLDHMFTYPTTNGVIDTIQWEGFREAIDDTRYLATLQKLIAENIGLQESRDAQMYLDTLKADVNYEPATARSMMIAHISNISQAINQTPTITAQITTTGTNQITLSGTVSDAEGYLSNVEYRVNGGSWVSLGPVTILNSVIAVNGASTIDVRATDAWGATTTTSLQYTPDGDADGVVDSLDNCPIVSNSNQLDSNGNGLGDVCDALDVALTLTANFNSVFAGQSLSYIATVTNAGPSTATGCTLTDTLPTGITPGAVNTSQGSCIGTDTITCPLGNLVMGGSATVSMTVTPNTTGVLNNSVSIACNEFDTNAANNAAYTSTAVDPAADLSLALTDTPDPVLLGQTVTYTTTVTNSGPSATSGVTATGTLPACNIGALAANTSASCTATVVANSLAMPDQTMTANGVDYDPDPTNNSATANTSAQAALTVTSSLNGTISSSPAGINCGTDCSEAYNADTQVILTATASSGYAFSSWTGCTSSTNVCTVIMDANKTVTANYVAVYKNPSANAAQSGGDNNGYQTTAANAYASDSNVAVDTNSGTNTNTSCTSSGKDKHLYYNYGFSLPAGATIKGIEVLLNARADSTNGSPKICVQLSSDGGANWTATKSTSTLTTSLTNYSMGGAADTWSRTWTPSELNNSNFRVRLIDVSSNTARDFSLNYVGVKVTY